MEVCGGQTHAIVRFGIDELLPPELTLVHGPGCPVCVTPRRDRSTRALAIAARPEVIFCSFGDMLRVPGIERRSVRRQGARAATCASSTRRSTRWRSPQRHPDREVVFFAVGFETTAPGQRAWPSVEARRRGLRNFSLLVSHVLVPPAMEAILERARRGGWTAFSPPVTSAR